MYMAAEAAANAKGLRSTSGKEHGGVSGAREGIVKSLVARLELIGLYRKIIDSVRRLGGCVGLRRRIEFACNPTRPEHVPHYRSARPERSPF